MCNMAVQHVPAEAAPDHECLVEISGATAEDDAEPTVLLLEEYLEGKFIKWNNNKSQVRRKNDAIPQVLLPYKAEMSRHTLLKLCYMGTKQGTSGISLTSVFASLLIAYCVVMGISAPLKKCAH